jgi:hypothetical protein
MQPQVEHMLEKLKHLSPDRLAEVTANTAHDFGAIATSKSGLSNTGIHVSKSLLIRQPKTR